MRLLRRAGQVAALGLLLTGCQREVLTDVPTLGTKPCTVRLGDPRGNVLLRCGAPCGGGVVAPDLRCDVYLSAEVCYREDQVVTLGRLAPFNGRFPWCDWSAPAPERSEGAPAAAPDRVADETAQHTGAPGPAAP